MSNRTLFTCREKNLNLWRLWWWMRRFLKLVEFFLIKKYNFIMTICLLNNLDYILGAFYFIGICELFFFLDINVFCSRCWMSCLYVLNFGSYYFSVGLVKQCDCLQVIAVEPVSDLKLNSRILQVLLFFSWSYMKSFCVECFSPFGFALTMQDSILQKVNGHPKAGWKAAMNHHFSNYTVSI
jgi:hypothetical protein